MESPSPLYMPEEGRSSLPAAVHSTTNKISNFPAERKGKG
jgi:hypothetical protein